MNIGDICPEFEGINQFNQSIKSKELIGKKYLVIFFYPKDFTPGCTAEVCGFRDNYEQFKELNCEVIGISADSISRHHSFTQKYNLNYHLLSDSNKKIRKIFKVPGHLFGIIPGRVTYVIDLEGKICGINNSLADAHSHIKFALHSLKN